MLTVSGLRCDYGGHRAVTDAGFVVPPGRVTGLLGPNGAGKSTTLNAICGLHEPTRGRIVVDGHVMGVSSREARAAIGYLPERPPLYETLSVEEFLAFCARLRGIPARARAEALTRALAACDLTGVKRRIIGRLSKGFQQRVGLAQAILHRPKVVLLDEPTAGLDPGQIRDLRALVRELGRDRCVVLSSHLLAEVEATCDDVVIMNAGEVVLSAPLARFSAERSPLRLRTGWHDRPDPGALRGLPGVLEVETAGPDTLCLTCSEHELAVRSVLRAALEHGWRLESLQTRPDSLEATFLALTQAPPAPDRSPRA